MHIYIYICFKGELNNILKAFKFVQRKLFTQKGKKPMKNVTFLNSFFLLLSHLFYLWLKVPKLRREKT